MFKNYANFMVIRVTMRGQWALLRTLLTAIAGFACLFAFPQEISFEKITTDNGLSHNTVFTIVQDRQGFMWFGTGEGLNRYDGSTIVSHYADPTDTTQLASNEINVLEIGPDGQLYIGTPLGLQVYDSRKGNFRRIQYQQKSIGQVNRIVSAHDSTLYICTNQGLYTLKKGMTRLSLLVGGANIRNLLEYKRGVFWYSTFHQLVMINEHGDVIKQYFDVRDGANHVISLTDNTSCLYKDTFGNIWLGSNKNGLLKYDAEQDVFVPVVPRHKSNPLEVNIVRGISEDVDGNLWIGTETGLFVYSHATNTFRHYTQSFEQPSAALNDKAIYSIYRSREGIMWVGTYFGGVNIDKPREKGFKVLKADGGVKALSGKAISDIVQDKRGNLWIATEDGGINIWNRKTGAISYLKNEPGKNSLSVNNVHALYEDGDVFWIGTFLGGVNKYDLRTKHFNAYKNDKAETFAFVNNMVYTIHRDRNGVLWIGTIAGLNQFDPKKDTYDYFRPEIFRGKFIYDLYEDRVGGMWICMSQSDSLYYYSTAARTFNKYRYYDSTAAPNIGFIAALEDSKGDMWFGTMNRGLVKFDRAGSRFSSYTMKDGLPNNFVYGLLEDARGNLWLSTNKGLSRFNPSTNVFTNYDASHGLANQFNYKSSFKDRDGWMYFGSINGLYYFHPDSLVTNDAIPSTYLSDFKLFNRSVPVAKGGVLEATVDATEVITLTYADNVITIDFGAINYSSSGNMKFAYFLEGFETDWNYVGAKNSATYTNLSPGSYTFKVKSANNDGVWSSNVRELRLVVLPPFWASTWALIVYSAIVIGMFLLYRAFLSYRNREKMAIQLERIEKEKIRELNQHKLNFFTYISHEFKTPLALILASIDKFLQLKTSNDDQVSGLTSIKRSAKRLQHLVDQLMEFRRIETDHAKMRYVNGDLIVFLRDTFFAFTPLFNNKGIDFYFNSDKPGFVTYFDADKLEKIITNLLSNAVKYSPAGAVIEMEVSINPVSQGETDIARIIICDTGVGMETEELSNVFTAFYQTEHGKKAGTGTGIGLSLVKSLMDFLNGRIEVTSKPNAGTQVSLTLPLPKHIVAGTVDKLEPSREVDLDHVLPPVDLRSPEKEEEEGAARIRYQLMIVEDSEELVSFLGSHFESKYKIVKAANGLIALNKLKKSLPDIIISDIMMPEMDGIELCRAIKSDLNTSHIPVIFLTAKTTIESKLEGLSEGADAYLAKPFSLKELDLVVSNLLSARSTLRDHFLKFGSVKNLDVTLVNRDQEFVLKLTQIVEANLDNASFNIGLFADAACVSRSLLHLKLKKLVNVSASEFIRNIRLKRAAELLRGTDFTVADVATKVGYADPNYFSRSFKEKYNVNPSDYKLGTDG